MSCRRSPSHAPGRVRVSLACTLWAVAALFVLVPSVQAADVRVCSIEAESAVCPEGFVYEDEANVLPYGLAVLVCRGGGAALGGGYSACASSSGVLRLRFPENFEDGDLVWVYSDAWREPDAYAFFLGGDPDPDPEPEPDPDAFDISDLDIDKVAGAFGSAFVLVGMFSLLGKGIGAILRVVKGRF